MLNLLNSTILNSFITQWGNPYYKLPQLFESAANLSQSKTALCYYKNRLELQKCGAGNLQCGSHLCKVVQVLQCEKTLILRGADITKSGSYYKVGLYIDQRYIKKSVRRIYCSGAFFSRGRIEVHVYYQVQYGLREELYNRLKLHSEGIDLFRKIRILMWPYTICNALAFIRHATFRKANNMM